MALASVSGPRQVRAILVNAAAALDITRLDAIAAGHTAIAPRCGLPHARFCAVALLLGGWAFISTNPIAVYTASLAPRSALR
jgi:hypothetical protein